MSKSSGLFHKSQRVQQRLLHAILIMRRYGIAGFWRLYGPFSGKKLVKIQLEDGLDFWLRKETSDFETLIQVGIYREMDLPIALDRPVIFDAGANIGLATRYLKMQYPDAQVVAIEPDPENYEMLVRNTEGLKGVSCVKGGVWWREQKLAIANKSDAAWAYRTEESEVSNEESIMAFTIPSLLDQFGHEKIDILKLDIESAEMPVLQHSTSWMGRVNSLLVETHDDVSPGCRLVSYVATKDFPYEKQLGEKIFFSRVAWSGAVERPRVEC